MSGRHPIGLAATTRRSASRKSPRQRLRRAVQVALETIEPRVMLSATLSYRPQKADGTLGSPVVFQSTSAAQNFTPQQVSLLQSGFAAPKFDMFLDLDGIPGESTDARHPNEIQVLSFNWGADSTGSIASGGGGGAGKAQVNEIHLTSRVSKASPLLLAKVASGVHVADAELSVRRPNQGGGQDFLTLDLADVTVGSYQITTALDGTFVEEYTLSFDRADLSYRAQKPDGTLDAPVQFHEKGAEALDFTPTEPSILQTGFVNPAGQKLFLSLDGISGESTDDRHANAIDVLAYGWGADEVTGDTSGGGAGVGKTHFEEMHFVANVSSASPAIIAAMTSGRHISSAHFAAARGAAPADYLTIDLDDAFVSSYQLSTDAAGKLVEEFTLTYADVSLNYKPQANDGTLGAPVHFAVNQPEVGDFKPAPVSLLDAHNLGSPAAHNTFLSLPGVAGESADDAHRGQIDVLSFNWGGDASGGGATGGGAGAGKATLQEVHVLSRVSKASPLLLARLASGQHLQNATLVQRRAAGQADYFTMNLGDVTVGSYRVTTAADGTFVEEYTLHFNQAAISYTPLPSGGGPGTPVTFQEHDIEVEDFAPRQASLLETDPVAPLSQNLFLHIDGINGESKADGHVDDLDILAFGWGGDALGGSASGGGGGAGKTVFQELHFVAPISAASPKLLAAMTAGQHISDAHFAAVRTATGAPQEYLTADLDDLIVSSYQVIVGTNGKLYEEFTLAPDDVAVDYRAQKPDGSLDAPVHFASQQIETADFKANQRSLLQSGNVHASPFNAFLKIDGIPGESTNDQHPNQIDVLSYSWGGDATHAVSSGGGAGVGKATVQDLHIVAHVSKASPALVAAMSTGDHLSEADLALVHPGGANQDDFYTLSLRDVFVSSYQVTTAADGTLLEEFTLSYGSSTLTYKPQDDNGVPGAPVVFQEQGLGIDVFAPTERSIIQSPFATPPALNLFLDVDGVAGESTSNTHAGAVDLLSFSWGGSNPLAIGSGSGGAGVGKATVQELHFVSRVSKASPTLLSRVLSGQHIPGATFAIQRKNSPQDFFKIQLKDVIVTSYQVTTAVDGSLVEEFTIAYGPGGGGGGATTGPIADAGGPYSVNDNGTVALDGTGTFDPNPDSLTYAWDLDGDGVFGETGAAGTRGDEVGPHPTFNADGAFGPATFTISLRVTDGAGLSDTATTSVRVIDVTPPDTQILTHPDALTNQTTATFTFTGSDQGTPADQLKFTWQLDGGAVNDATSPLTLSTLADGTHTIVITAIDQAGNADPTPATFTWKIDSRGPAVLNPRVTPNPDRFDFLPLLLTATVSDAATGNSNITGAQFSLDGGTTWFPLLPADLKFDEPTETVFGLLPPLPPGVYTVSVRGTDAAGNTGPVSTVTLPVFDRHGKINGDGAFTSPAGADPANPTSTGVARFSVNAKYKGNDNTPSGDVSLQFGSLKFQSTSLDYLVIDNTGLARLAGSGKINGQGDYGFELTALEGQNGKHGTPDLFRIRIVNKANGQVVYDNGLGAPIAAPPTTPLKTGKLKIDD